MHISNTTVSGNSASDEGGGILNAGTTNISNSTVSGNSAPEGGGIYHAFGTTNISSSIVSGNSANSGDEVYGTVIANNNNLFGNSSQSNSDAFVNFTPGANDINATTDGENVALDNILDPDGLQDNGGSNKTIALVLGSPATNAGNNDDNLSTDQRGTGFTRVFNQQPDIGAFESVFELEVNTLNDEDDGIADGEISLRDALRMITDGGTITFADSIANGTIILNGTELVIDKSVTIDGDTNNITVSGNNNSRVFNINDGDNNTQQVVNISGLTITQGNSSGNGGGIYNSENLTLSNSTVSGNSSDAFGGGILNLSGTTNISNSTVSDNSASFGGAGILNSGTTSISNSTVSGNLTTNNAAGILNWTGTTNISNSTVSGNSATNSGGGIFNLSGTTNISSSIVSGNNANSGDEIYGTVIANNNNLFGNSSQSNSDAFVNFSPGVNDINATTDGENVHLDNILDPNGLEDNLGLTQTIALVAGSPALDTGNNDDNLLTDQRGTVFERVINQQADIGAFEWSNLLLKVNTLVDENDGIEDGEISLRDALGAIPDGGTIIFADSIANGTITLNGTELVINKSVTIDGDTDNITISGNNNSRVFSINDGNDNTKQVVNIRNLTITKGDKDLGGGIYNRENLTLSSSTLKSNDATRGAGILNDSGTVDIINSTVSNNHASRGGGIFNDSGTVNIINTTVYGNFASVGESLRGGGIFNISGTINIGNSTISGNVSADEGGGIFNLSGTTNISNSIVSGNFANNSGEEVSNSLGIIIANNNNLFGHSGVFNSDAFLNFTPGDNDLILTANWINNTLPLANILDPNGLQDNGGLTKTIALVTGSPAINNGSNPNNLTTDQRGLARNDGNGVDIGAVEVVNGNGVVVNGYLAGATVFLDINFNYIQDDNEPVTITDFQGQYSFTLAQLFPFDTNNNNQIDPQEGQIIVIGGTDTTTGQSSVIPLLSQGFSTTQTNATSPLTTLKTVFNNQGMDADTLLNKIEGLNLASLETNLDNYDPYTAIAEGDNEAINIISGHIQVMNLLINGASLLDASGYNGSDNQIQTIIALGNVLENVDTFNLSNSDNLSQLFTQLDNQLNLNIDSTIITAIANIIAQSNQQIDELVANGLNQGANTLLSSINPIKQALYDNLPALTEQLIKGEITPESAQNQVNQLVNRDSYLLEYALSPNHTVSVFANDNVTEGSDTNGQFTIQLGETAPNQGLTILYTLSGTATIGEDYTLDGSIMGEIIINGGENQALLDVTILDDEIGEIPESITLNLQYVGDGFILDPIYNTAIVEIIDNDEYSNETNQTGIIQSGGYGDDTIIGSDQNDLIQGSYGDDVIDSLESNDFLQGGAGEDTVIAGAGSDRVEGNFGDDSLTGNAGDDYIQGGSGDDVIIGNEGQDQLLGNAGDDSIEGNQGNDVIEGGFGKDLLQGNEDNDWLLGDADNDILIGGLGNDVLNGGSGADVFYFNTPAEANDLILDFNPEEGDIIQISSTGFGIDNLDNFTFLAGQLQYNGETLALIQNNGQTYNTFADLTQIISLVNQPTGVNLEIQSPEESQTLYNSATLDMVANPEVTIYDDIIERGYLKVATAVSGAEFDLEFTNAMAAAIFGDATKVELVNPSFTEGFEMVATGAVDISARRITKTSGRDATLNIDFSPIYFYDYQGVLVRQQSGIDNALELDGHTIGVIEGSTALTNLEILLSSNGVEFEPRFYESTSAMFADYDAGNIDALSTDRSLIYGRLDTLSEPDAHHILDVEFSSEPIAMVLPEDDSQWNNVVKWVINATIEAEELGLNSDNIEQILAVNKDENPNNDSDPAIRRFLGIESQLGEALGLPNDFAYNIVKLVGNYDEIYDRHFPDLERDRNLLYSDGGLLYSPPFSGSFDEDNATIIDNDDRDLLQEIKDRGILKLGINGQNPGFSFPDENGSYIGFDVDLGKAIAVAVFNDSNKIEFVEREDRVTWLTNVANGVVDVTAAQVTQNLVRDGKAGVDFISPYLYTGQGFLVRKDSGILNLATLNGHEVGLFSGTTAEQNLQDAMKEYGGTFIPVYYDNLDEMLAGYAQGDIDAIINDLPLLGGLIDTFSNPDEHLLLDDVISKEPLSMVVDENQSDWKDAVSWVQYGLLQAEEYGITQDNIDQILADNTDSNPDNDSDISTRIFLGIEGNAGELLGLENDYMVNVIKAVGNYGEIYERHFDSDILPRDFNQLSGDFGLQIPYPQGITVNPTNDVSINNEPPVFGSLGNETLDAGIDPGFDGTDDIVFGGSGNDLIDTVAGTGGNRVYGQSGNDTLTLGGNDRAFGGTGDDRFFLLGGDNIVTGGAGADQFWIANAEIPESPHTVTDFDLEDDLLNIAGLGVGSFNELTLSNEDGNALIAFEENKLAQLIGVNADSLSADHFGLIQ